MKSRLVLSLAVCSLVSWIAAIGHASIFAQILEGSIAGTVIDRDNGEPLESATIRLVATPLSCPSTREGEFDLKHVPAGIYQIEVSLPGYITLLTQIRVRPNIENQIKLRLVRARDPNDLRRAEAHGTPMRCRPCRAGVNSGSSSNTAS